MTKKEKRRGSLCVLLHNPGAYPNASIQYENGVPMLTIIDENGNGYHFVLTRSELRLLAKRINQFLEATR